MGERWMGRGRRTAILAIAIATWIVVSAGVGSTPALAEYEINDFARFPFSAFPASTQAGGHSDLHLELSVDNHWEQIERGEPTTCYCEDAKDITTRFPTGVIGNPNNVPRCTQVDFDNLENCSPDTQVGVAVPGIFFNPHRVFEIHTPVFNLEPHPDQAGLLGFFLPLANTPAYIVLSARTDSDYGLNAEVHGIFHGIPLDSFKLNLWGVPADPIHEPERCRELQKPRGFQTGECEGFAPSNAELKPFLDNPTVCNGPLSTTLRVVYYHNVIENEEAEWPGSTGCDQLSYNPSLFAQPTTSETDSPSGLDVDLRVPQLQSPTTPSPSETRATTVTLPRGMAINPNAADGKLSCSESQARFGTVDEAQCPDLAKVGTLSLTSTALAGPIPGAIYIGDPQPGDRYRLFLTANGFATHVKLAGSVAPDPQTGQLVVSFQNLPQTPFSDFNLHFFGSERGLLTTPPRCGTYPVTSTFTPWDATLSPQTSTQFFTLDSGPGGTPCPGSARPFNPGFQAAVTDATAGVHSPFFIHLTRSDGDQTLAALNVITPPGLLGTLAGIPYCPDAALAAAAQVSYSGHEEEASPSCPAASQIGTSDTGAGAGTHPVYLPGKVYLAGPYRGAPLSLAVITPAVSGPYDLGNVVVRAAVRVNPETAQLTAVSDPLPQILQGIPLRLRSILVDLNRQGFMVNPTNCDPLAVGGQITGDEGAVAHPSQGFQAANCSDLGFAPKLSLRLSGSTRRTGNPGLTATLTTKPGQANISRTEVTLPSAELIDNAHISNPCTRVQFSANACPAGSVIGFAKAETPLLDKPLEGPVYLRSSSHKLPDVVAALRGQIDIDLDGKIETIKKRLHTTFQTVPDAPVTRFTLSLYGGKRGLLQNSENLCSAPLNTLIEIDGQNGKLANRSLALGTPCAAKARRKRKHHTRVGG
jgi:hypothetical protein